MSELNLMLMSTSNHLLASLGYFLHGSYALVTYPRTQWYVNTAIFLITLGRLEVGCVWGRGRWGERKEKKVGELCVWGEGEEGGGRWGERREFGELCVGPSHAFASGGGGWCSKYFGKWGYLHGAWRSKLRVY